MKEIRVRRKNKSFIGMILGLVIFGALYAFADKLGIPKEYHIPFAFGALALFPLFVIIWAIVGTIWYSERREYIEDMTAYYMELGKSKGEARKQSEELWEAKMRIRKERGE